MEIIHQIIGLLGEVCTFYGGVILAKDVLGRENEHKKRLKLEVFTVWLHEKNLPLQLPDHDHLDMRHPNAVPAVLNREAVMLGKRGVFWLVFGFAFLLLDRALTFMQVFVQTW